MNTPARAAGPIRVGATGHRPNNLTAADPPLLRRRLRAVLTALGAAADTRPAIVCSLAEGTDRLVIAEAIALECSFTVVLPFARAEFARDFDHEPARADYAALLARAAEVVELPGVRDAFGHGAAYAAANEAILARSDLLLAVWDGHPNRGPGGTETFVRRALADGLPVLQIESFAPHRIQLLGDRSGGVEFGELGTLLGALANH